MTGGLEELEGDEEGVGVGEAGPGQGRKQHNTQAINSGAHTRVCTK